MNPAGGFRGEDGIMVEVPHNLHDRCDQGIQSYVSFRRQLDRLCVSTGQDETIHALRTGSAIVDSEQDAMSSSVPRVLPDKGYRFSPSALARTL